MAKAPTPAPTTERAPVTARGADLLALVLAAGDAGLMLTQEEGLDAVTAGFLIVDQSVTDGPLAKVTLTEAGNASLSSSGNSATSFEIEDNIPLPGRATRRGRVGGYPFDNLNVGQSFHIAAKAGEEPAAIAARLQSSVSGARARFAEPTGENEAFTVKTYAKGADGKFLKGEDGKRVVATSTEQTRPVTRLTRDFTVKAVDASDPKGAGARVWRVAVGEGQDAAPAA